MDWLQVIVLALLQGITEFLPVSSSAHLILPAQLTEWPDQGLAFDVAVHAGTLVAVLAFFRAEVTGLFTSAGTLVAERRIDTTLDLWIKVAVATLPVLIAGFIAKDFVESELRTVKVMAITTIVFGILLGLADRRTGTNQSISWPAALIIGFSQVVALIPGTSRSGITMTAALFLGLSRTNGARFSMLLSIPTILGAALLITLDILERGLDVGLAHLAGGFLLSAVSAFVTIRYFMLLVERTGMMPYVVYRLLLGTVLLVFFV
jgi:undecaprenyl-diphosphatase